MRDYKLRLSPSRPRRRLRRAGLLLLLLLLAALGIGAWLLVEEKPGAPVPTPRSGQPGESPMIRDLPLPAPKQSATIEPAPAAAPLGMLAAAAPLPEAAVQTPTASSLALIAIPTEPAEPADPGHWLEHRIERGDSLSSVFAGFELSPSLLHRIVNSGPTAKALAQIRPGERLRLLVDGDNDIRELTLERDPVHSLVVRRTADGYTAENVARDVEIRVAEVTGTVTDSLFQSATDAGLSETLTMELAEIFGWDIDFALEVRNGDAFTLIYEQLYLDGEKLRDGAILAAEYFNRGKAFRALRYTDSSGGASYYSPEGRSMRKAFLRSPVDFRRISSRFQTERWHPVLGKKRPHRGVDYAAATGTPVRASGDGRVEFVGTKGGYGKTVVLKHAGRYTTLYGHLSRFTKGLKAGMRVRQGQIIGAVGRTGLATGPHLHYEFRIDGVHRNPLKVEFPAAEPVPEHERDRFRQQTQPLLARLIALTHTLVADAHQ